MCKTSDEIPFEAKVSDVSRNIDDATSNITGEAIVEEKVLGPASRTGTILAGYSVLTKSMLGSGLFFMAYACQKFGIAASIVAVFIAWAITFLSLRILAVLAIEFKEDEPSFYSLSVKLVPRFKWVVDAAVIVNCLGASIGYVITAGNLLARGLHQMIQWNLTSLSIDSTKMIIQAAILLLLAPLCMMKEISGTKIANLVGLTSLLYIVIVTFCYCDLSQASAAPIGIPHFWTAMGQFPTFVFAFACQMNVFPIANELKNPTVKRMDVISLASTLTGLIVYIPIMILPVLTFGAAIGANGNYLLVLDNSKTPVQVAYTLAALSVSISYVLQIHPLRRSILCLYYGDRIPGDAEEKRNRIFVVGVSMLVTFAVAFKINKIDLVTNFTGLFGGVTLCFLMPAVLYLQHFGYRKGFFGRLVLALLGFSILLFPLCITGIIYDMIWS